MKYTYEVEYSVDNDGQGLQLVDIFPESKHVEELFYNGVITYNVAIDIPGEYILEVMLDDETGDVTPKKLLKYQGWKQIDFY